MLSIHIEWIFSPMIDDLGNKFIESVLNEKINEVL